MTASIGRFASPELLQLGRPPALAAKDFETLYGASLNDMIARLNGAGLSFDMQKFEVDPASALLEAGAYRDMLRRQAIDDAVAESYLGSASGSYLDQRAADYGVVRRVLQFANPVTGAELIMEDDESLRLRARLAWEALSVAGPAGAYVFHALDAHPDVFDVIALGPETGIVQPGEVLVVVQSRTNSGVPSDAVLDVIADRLDAYEVVYGNGTSSIRDIRNSQSVRPLGARVTVAGGRPLLYNTTATLYVGSYADRDALRTQALAQLTTYQSKMQRLWRRISREGRQAALSLVGADGLPVIDEVEVLEDDIQPSHFEIPTPGAVTLNMVVR